jgi:hypothetical protein
MLTLVSSRLMAWPDLFAALLMIQNDAGVVQYSVSWSGLYMQKDRGKGVAWTRFPLRDHSVRVCSVWSLDIDTHSDVVYGRTRVHQALVLEAVLLRHANDRDVGDCPERRRA